MKDGWREIESRGRVERSKCLAGRTMFSVVGFGVFPRSEGAGEAAAALANAPCLRFLPAIEEVLAEVGMARMATSGDNSRGVLTASIADESCADINAAETAGAGKCFLICSKI